MSNDESFEDRLRALADQVARSLSGGDLDEALLRLGADAERARGLASDLERWLSVNLFDRGPRSGGQSGFDGPARDAGAMPSGAGPHPLDLPTSEQGIALSALDSGRLTARPGSGALAATGADPKLSVGTAADVVNELRARDWITTDGTLTLVGRQALLRWCQTAGSSTERSQPRET